MRELHLMSLKYFCSAVAIALGASFSLTGGASAAAVVKPADALAVQQQSNSETRSSTQDIRHHRRGHRRWGRHRRWGHRRYSRRHYRRGPRFGIYLGAPLYYGYSRPYYRSYRGRYRGRCGHWHRRCVANWGYRNSSYYGCMRYHGC